MSEHDNPNDPVEPTSEQPVAEQPADQPAAPAPPAPAAFAEPPAPAPTSRWRDRVFRMRSVAAVAVAGVIIGATGGAVTTALVTGDHHDRGGRHEIMRFGQPGVPVLPPDGRMRFPGDQGDGEVPVPPLPPGMDDGTEDGTDDGTDGESGGSSSGDGTDQQSGLAQS